MSSLESAIQDHSRRFESNTYVYPVISRRAGGISIGVNLNINKKCNFSCVYCQVDRTASDTQPEFDISQLRAELETILHEYQTGVLGEYPQFKDINSSKKQLKDICISGDGEATTRPEFLSVCQLIHELQSTHSDLNLKLILITNATMLNRPAVAEGVALITSNNGEIWTKLDAGTEAWFSEIDRSSYTLNTIVETIAHTAQKVNIQIQTMVCSVNGTTFTDSEIDAYIGQVRRIVDAGKENVLAVQLYSVARQTTEEYCTVTDMNVLQNMKLRLEGAIPGVSVLVY